jgi:hypothetical protein
VATFCLAGPPLFFHCGSFGIRFRELTGTVFAGNTKVSDGTPTQKAALASVLVRFGLSIRAATSSGRSISRKEIDSFESVADFVKNSGILAELHAVAAGEQLDALVQFARSFLRTSPSNFRRNRQEKRKPTKTNGEMPSHFARLCP